MLISGFTFIRNAKKYDFPFRECVESMLPVVDELIINVGKSEDGTEEYIASTFTSPKIKLVHSVWDDTKIKDGVILSEQTNIALDACQGRWCLYLQGDEAIHEAEHALLRRAIEEEDGKPEPEVDGLRFRYFHFFGGYSLIQRPWRWYPSEIRVIRRSSGARSFGDAQSFHIPGAKSRHDKRGEKPDDHGLRTRLLDAHLFHYGHARAPEKMAQKNQYFHRFWHGDNHQIPVEVGYRLELKDLTWYWGTHPKPYSGRVAAGLSWSPKPSKTVPRYEKIVITHEAGEHALAQQLKELLTDCATKGLLGPVRVSVAAGSFQTLKAFGAQLFSREPAALVDLSVESHSLPARALRTVAALAGFRWRVAHAPQGRLPGYVARGYSAISWGSHEKRLTGFRVPGSEYPRQLARWLGADV